MKVSNSAKKVLLCVFNELRQNSTPLKPLVEGKRDKVSAWRVFNNLDSNPTPLKPLMEGERESTICRSLYVWGKKIEPNPPKTPLVSRSL